MKWLLFIIQWLAQFSLLRRLILRYMLWRSNMQLYRYDKIIHPEVEVLEEQLFGEFRRTWPRPTDADVRKAPPPQPPNQGWVLFQYNTFIGFILYRDYIQHWYVSSFGVDPTLNGKGYGTILGLQLLIEADNIQRPLIAMVRAGHHRTENLYLRAGFMFIRESDGSISKNIMGSSRMHRPA